MRLPGYVVPLEEVKGELKEFLLVPYFGACIHSPPPPANQIVHVTSRTPLKGWRTMDAVWVNGTLKAARSESRWAPAATDRRPGGRALRGQAAALSEPLRRSHSALN